MCGDWERPYLNPLFACTAMCLFTRSSRYFSDCPSCESSYCSVIMLYFTLLLFSSGICFCHTKSVSPVLGVYWTM